MRKLRRVPEDEMEAFDMLPRNFQLMIRNHRHWISARMVLVVYKEMGEKQTRLFFRNLGLTGPQESYLSSIGYKLVEGRTQGEKYKEDA